MIGLPSGSAYGRGVHGPRARGRVLLPLLAIVLMLTACDCTTDRRLAEGALEEATEASFYTLPAPLPAGKPGEIVRTEKLLSAPPGAVAWRVLYHSTDVTGADIVVSGAVVGPDAAATPAMAELCLIGQHAEPQAEASALVGHGLLHGRARRHTPELNLLGHRAGTTCVEFDR